ncbi:unnamed protein product [Diatraea saccharalis]|uniref:Uncharacterized protein n=1 Tax=Diatraea saccharalis TaxID=40085 RepID=A0A9N9R7A4_9NEOP|nr:unnamed protein product [Diatraea saccharalis]
MDGTVDHSDSDSGESWTLLESTLQYADEVPEFPETALLANKGELQGINNEKDEDTDGISIISDSEPESPLPCEINYDCRQQDLEPQCVSIKPSLVENSILQDSMNDTDFLSDSNGKHKTYVHRRNKRLSTVLNIIVLGSVITAAGVAIGHMWGAKNDCTVNTVPSINKILSNLYKLQEENAYLRSKLKELAQTNNINIYQRKPGTESISHKQNKCKKVFEDSITNKNVGKPIKCVDGDENTNIHNIHLIEPEYEKQFIQNIDKLKDIYKQNRSWLDLEIDKRLIIEKQFIKKSKNDIKLKSTQPKKNNIQGQMPSKGNYLEPISETLSSEINSHIPDSSITANLKDQSIKDYTTERKITYADSLKSNEKRKYIPLNLDVSTKTPISKAVEYIKKNGNNLDNISTYSISEEEFKKDDRYVGERHKQARKKRDRQKSNKKQKRKNKYEQWEMKGGYLRDYDDFSISSVRENENVLSNTDKNHYAKEFERENYIEQFLDIKKSQSPDSDEIDIQSEVEKEDKNKRHNFKEKDASWFEKRALFRKEARKKLENELFGETSPNNAGWYFRRMQRREQCRAKRDNSTYKKLSKRNMNYKMKH